MESAQPGALEAVERGYRQWNAILRDYLRTETALRLTVGDDARAVPVRVASGMPREFGRVLWRLQGLEWLLMNRPAIRGVRRA